MKKRNLKKMKLAKETVLQLNDGHLEKMEGGNAGSPVPVSKGGTCPVTCQDTVRVCCT
jgi:hypothetical protein